MEKAIQTEISKDSRTEKITGAYANAATII